MLSSILPLEVSEIIFKFLDLADLISLIRAQTVLSGLCQTFVHKTLKKLTEIFQHLWREELLICGHCFAGIDNDQYWHGVYVCGSCVKIYRPTLQIFDDNLLLELGCPFSYDDTNITLTKIDSVLCSLENFLSS